MKINVPNWVVIALGEDCSAFAGKAYTDEYGLVVGLFRELTGADKVTQIRRTMDQTWQAYCSKDGQKLGYYVLYEEE